jgi:hypothetical protein
MNRIRPAWVLKDESESWGCLHGERDPLAEL